MAEELDYRILFVFLSAAREVSCTLQIFQGSGESEGWLGKKTQKTSFLHTWNICIEPAK